MRHSECRKGTTMEAAVLRAIQAPIKERYNANPEDAYITLKARGTLDDQNIACKVETGRLLAVAGLHPATGGTGLELCSGDMLLEALVACAGVTLKAVATALGNSAQIRCRLGGGGSRFPGHARRFQGNAGWFCADPPGLRRRNRGLARGACPARQTYGALLRRLPDHQQRCVRCAQATAYLGGLGDPLSHVEALCKCFRLMDQIRQVPKLKSLRQVMKSSVDKS